MKHFSTKSSFNTVHATTFQSWNFTNPKSNYSANNVMSTNKTDLIFADQPFQLPPRFKFLNFMKKENWPILDLE